ncbi:MULTISPECIES: EpaQ family protein [Enterococcus]|uniref:EpaQ family protein n=1 Tax=Enterococcus sp. AZ103 TaxID=2774628 RepID=UPI003F2963B4
MRNKFTKEMNTISIVLLFGMIILCYSLWTFGIRNQFMFGLYSSMQQIMFIMASIGIFINLAKMKSVDIIWILLAIFSIVFFVFFNNFRESNFFRDTALALIIFTVLNVKYTEFDKSARIFLLGIVGIFLLITVYRIFTEIPVTEGVSIWSGKNKPQEIWINTNTIGASVMTQVLIMVPLLHSLKIKWTQTIVYLLYVIGLSSLWVVQSQAAFFALTVFVLVDICPKEIIVKKKNILKDIYTGFLVLIFPVSLCLAYSEKIDLFTGREEIWQSFYHKLFESTESFLVGPKPFVFIRRGVILGHHNSYNATLGQYGLIGFILLISFIVYNVWTVVSKKTFSSLQAGFLIAFFSVLLQSTMEDGLMAAFWIPVTFILLGFALKTDNKKGDISSLPRNRASRRNRRRK